MPTITNAHIYHVFGPTAIQVGTGTSKALQTLGYSQDGVEITLEPRYRPIYSDVGGQEVPVDYQYMGTTARISCDLVDWKEDTIRLMRQFNKDGLTSVDAVEIAVGRLVGGNTTLASSRYLPLAISGGLGDDDPWYFQACIASEPQQFKLGTQQTIYRVGFTAITYVSPGSPSRAVLPDGTTVRTPLYTRSIP